MCISSWLGLQGIWHLFTVIDLLVCPVSYCSSQQQNTCSYLQLRTAACGEDATMHQLPTFKPAIDRQFDPCGFSHFCHRSRIPWTHGKTRRQIIPALWFAKLTFTFAYLWDVLVNMPVNWKQVWNSFWLKRLPSGTKSNFKSCKVFMWRFFRVFSVFCVLLWRWNWPWRWLLQYLKYWGMRE